jgi:hypothetical protein
MPRMAALLLSLLTLLFLLLASLHAVSLPVALKVCLILLQTVEEEAAANVKAVL